MVKITCPPERLELRLLHNVSLRRSVERCATLGALLTESNRAAVGRKKKRFVLIGFLCHHFAAGFGHS